MALRTSQSVFQVLTLCRKPTKFTTRVTEMIGFTIQQRRGFSDQSSQCKLPELIEKQILYWSSQKDFIKLIRHEFTTKLPLHL